MSKKSVISMVETLLLVLLLFAMLIQCIFFISLTQNNSKGSLPMFPESEAQLLVYGSLDAVESSKSAVTPYIVGAIHDGSMHAGLYDDELGREVFGHFARVLENAPGGTAKKVVYSDSEKKYEYLDELYNGTEECYYVKLRDGIEFSVLCQLMSDTYTDIPENPDFVIKDMFLVCGALDEASMIAVDGEGNVLKIHPSKNIPFNKEYLEAYNNTEKVEFEFVKIADNIAEDKNCYFPSFRYSVSYDAVLTESFSDSFDMSAESADLKSMVRIFGMNGDNTRFYKRASDGAMICVEDTTSFEMMVDGSFVFGLGDGDNNLDNLLENTVSEYGFFEYADAARNIVSSLNEKFSDHCGMISVRDIVYSDGECRFIYDYTVNGVPIENNGENDLELVFGGDSLVSAKGRIRIMTCIGKERTDMPQRTAYVLMKSAKGAVSYFGPEMCFDEEGASVMRWTVKYGSYDGGMEE